MAPPWVKICGVTTPEDAEVAFSAGADAVGLNFVPSSPRFVTLPLARLIIDAQNQAREWVGVFADVTEDDIVRAHGELGLSRVQLHGHEPPEFLERLLRRGIRAYQAVRIGSAGDVEEARRFAGDRLLVDAKVAGQLGGTGHRVEPSLVAALAKARPLVLAGGLTPDNVAALVGLVRPFGVDTASGVEESPGRKDANKVRAFVRAARG